MQEEVTPQTTEESAPVSEAITEQQDISEKYTPAQLQHARKNYIKGRKEEIEILSVDVEFLDLQIKHYNLTKEVAKINAEIQESKKLADSADFKKKISITG